jgi:hypothetical protein
VVDSSYFDAAYWTAKAQGRQFVTPFRREDSSGAEKWESKKSPARGGARSPMEGLSNSTSPYMIARPAPMSVRHS